MGTTGRMMPGIMASVLIVFLLTGCGRNGGNGSRVPVARVFDNYLYMDDLVDVLPEGLPAEDSLAAARDFVNKWVRSQLILNKAELNLTDEEKDVEQQIEDYRSSLLIYIYEQSYTKQMLDTLISDGEIQAYLEDNPSNFVLPETIIQGSFIQVPATAPEIYRLRQWCNSGDPENDGNIEAYCVEHAESYDHFEGRWVNLSEVLELLPRRLYSPESTVRNRRLIEMRNVDSTYYYFLTVRNYALGGDVSPLDLVEDDIRSILLNKRKMEIVNDLESSIFNDGQDRGYFTIY
jgi:hypothetical protein